MTGRKRHHDVEHATFVDGVDGTNDGHLPLEDVVLIDEASGEAFYGVPVELLELFLEEEFCMGLGGHEEMLGIWAWKGRGLQREDSGRGIFIGMANARSFLTEDQTRSYNNKDCES